MFLSGIASKTELPWESWVVCLNAKNDREGGFVGSFMMRRSLVAAVCLLVASGACDRKRDVSKWTNQNVTAMQSYGDTIVAAIESYKLKNGAYPTTLEALVPEFMSGIEDATTGSREWAYVVTANGTAFELGFAANENRYPCYYWSSGKGKWIRDE